MRHLRDTKSILGAILFAMLFSISIPAYGQDAYGSITFSPNTGQGFAYGYSWNYYTRESARQRATRECRNKGGSSCREVSWFRNSCAALAITSEGGYGTAWHTSRSNAESMAVSNCRSAGNSNCRIAVSRCITAGGEPSTTGFMAKMEQPAQLTRDQRRKVQSGVDLELTLRKHRK